MTPKELSEIMNRLEKYYKNFYSGLDKKEVFAAWYDMFRDDDAGEMMKASVIYIRTNAYPPTVAGIANIMSENRLAGQMTEMEAWNRIRKAIDNANDRPNAAEAYAKLPPLLKKLVCDPNRLRTWYRCDDNTLEGVVASNIQRSYRELARREVVYNALPGQLQAEQSWRVEGPKEQTALPEPHQMEKTISQVVEEANARSAEHGMIMTDELRRKHASRLDGFFTPMTEAEKKLIEKRETEKAERYLK